MSVHDIVVVGGGCIGCSVARSLSRDSDLDVAVVEKEHHLAAHQSGRNSGVLHPGFNYEPGTLKAQFATEGTNRAKAYAKEHDIPLLECGVVVVARTAEEVARLEELQRQADDNGVRTDLIHGADAIAAHEPHASGRAALLAPEAASIDAQQYVYALARDAVGNGVQFYTGTRVEGVRRQDDRWTLSTSVGAVDARYVVNCAGLHADELAAAFGVGTDVQVVPFRGEYYEVVPEKRDACRSMIYPTPDPDLPFLGVHYTRRTDGKVIVGPNAVLALGREAYDNTDFDVRELYETLSYPGFRRLLRNPKMVRVAWEEFNKSYRKGRFVDAARKLVPSLNAGDFAKSYAGIRAQLVSADGRLVKQPRFEHTESSTHVLNAVSPGLTCSLPFGDRVAEEVIANI
jgi:L-2-hydroxyglutarate oxidase